MLPFFMRKSAPKYKPEKHEKYPKKGQMAIRRVLVLIQVGGCADGRLSPPVTLGAARLGRRDKHTPITRKQTKKHENKATTGGASPLSRLAYAPRIPSR